MVSIVTRASEGPSRLFASGISRTVICLLVAAFRVAVACGPVAVVSGVARAVQIIAVSGVHRVNRARSAVIAFSKVTRVAGAVVIVAVGAIRRVIGARGAVAHAIAPSAAGARAGERTGCVGASCQFVAVIILFGAFIVLFARGSAIPGVPSIAHTICGVQRTLYTVGAVGVGVARVACAGERVGSVRASCVRVAVVDTKATFVKPLTCLAVTSVTSVTGAGERRDRVGACSVGVTGCQPRPLQEVRVTGRGVAVVRAVATVTVKLGAFGAEKAAVLAVVVPCQRVNERVTMDTMALALTATI